MSVGIPQTLKVEHQALQRELVRAETMGRRTAEAARAVAKLMRPHFLKEEKYALPALELLVPLSQGKFEPEMAEVVVAIDKLEAELPNMLADHKAISDALQRLVIAATSENNAGIARFAEKLIAHARSEEQIAYPAAVLVGRYLKKMLADKAA